MRWGFVLDQSACIGCHACTVGCKAENDVPLGAFRTWVKWIERGEFPDTVRSAAVLRCNHCEDAPCVAICPTIALHKREDGIVDLDRDLCIGCSSCMQACPYDAIHIDPREGTAAKCHLCAHRLEVDLAPACVSVCPEQAIKVVDLDDTATRTELSEAGATVRKAERGTRPQTYYLGADPAVLDPLAVDGSRTLSHAEVPNPMPAPGTAEARAVYDIPRERRWGGPIAAYMVTKAFAAGALLYAAMGSANSMLFGWLSLVFTIVTVLLLIGDLGQPRRFFLLLTSPNTRSWLVRGGWILTAHALLSLAWGLGVNHVVLGALSVPVALATAVYTAFLFWQARGRELWAEDRLLPFHLGAQALAAASALGWCFGEWSAAPLVLHALVIVAGFLWTPATAAARQGHKLMCRDRLYAAGVLFAFVAIAFPPALLVSFAALDWAYVKAGQEVPLMKFIPDQLTAAPPPEKWDHWIEYDAKAWPRKVKREMRLVPTICFNCESGCGLLAYVDKATGEIRRFEGNPVHPGSRGRVCAKGPATLNQVNDPERILHPLKRVGPRGSGEFERVSWDEVLDLLAARIRKALEDNRRTEVMYHVGRPGHDGTMDRILKAWGVDGHNSHTNVCSSAARVGYTVVCGADRPSPDYTNAKTVLLLSAHLEAGHYFNPHAQRIIEGMQKGAPLIVMDPRLSNTAAKANLWLPTWPGSEGTILLSIARYLLEADKFDSAFVETYTNWEATLEHLKPGASGFDAFLDALKDYLAEFSFERAEEESGVSRFKLLQAAEFIGAGQGGLASHVWRGPATGNLGGWQIARALELLNVLTGSVGTKGGTLPNSWNKFVPPASMNPPAQKVWSELLYPKEYPLAYHEQSPLLPYLVTKEQRIDTYFTRVFNPVWTYPDGTAWIELLTDEERMGLHVALTPTWNETARYADYVLPMGHSPERHDLLSQETHAGAWIGFRQPVQRVLAERDGKKVEFSYETNPGEVWEEEEFFFDYSWRIDPDGALGVRRHFESPYRPGEKITLDEHYRWIFENSVPGLPAVAEAEGLTPLQYMRKYGAFEVTKDQYNLHEKQGFKTPSGKLEIFSKTLHEWGWPEYAMPGSIESHVAKTKMGEGEMVLVPTFRLATLIHSRSANAEWLYEISHKNPLWMHPSDAERIGVTEDDLVRVETDIGHFVLRPFVTEGLLPGIVACSHHLGRWHPVGMKGSFSSAPVEMTVEGDDWQWRRVGDASGPGHWWTESGVHQNITFPVHPDPISGMHCWHQKVRVVRGAAADRFGDIAVDRAKARAVHEEWKAMTRPPKGDLRRPLWFARAVRPSDDAYKL